MNRAAFIKSNVGRASQPSAGDTTGVERVVWAVILAVLGYGLLVDGRWLLVVLPLSILHVAAAWILRRRLSDARVQVRLAYALVVGLGLLPHGEALLWVAAIGTQLLLAINYCFAARVLALMPWNRRKPLTLDLVRCNFFSLRSVVPWSRSAAAGRGGCEHEMFSHE